MNISQHEIVIKLIQGQTSFNALSAIEALSLGYDTPLAKEHGVETYKATIRSVGYQAIKSELSAHRRRLTRQMKQKTQHIIVEMLSALGCCILMVCFTLMVLGAI